MVTGVVRDLPHNTQIAGNVFIPNTSIANPMSPGFKKTSWLGAGGWGYVELQPGADPQSVMAKLPALIDRNFDLKKTLGLSLRGAQARATSILRRSVTIIFPATIVA